MLVTTKEARGLYCPTPDFELCVADHCMAWRWAYGYKRHDDPEAKGYCGLAGKPWEDDR